MFFLNLTAGEFFALLGVVGGAITALYFLDRSKRRRVVSTLQFWVSAAGASEQRSRKKVSQPWSLLLQLLSLALLLLAIGQLQWGKRPSASRDHVVLLDTSAWSAARVNGASGETVLTREIGLARQYLGSLPAQDRVQIARVDALITPATPFTPDRKQWVNALRETSTSDSALNLTSAITYAQQAQKNSTAAGGEIVYIGPGRIDEGASPAAVPANLRVLPVRLSNANVGIRRVEVRRGDSDSGSWQAQIGLRNYSNAPRTITLRTQFAGTRFAARTYRVKAGAETTAEYNFVTNTGGELRVEIEGEDSLAEDNRATLHLPGSRTFTVTVYTQRPETFRPLLNADRRVQARYLDPSQAGKEAGSDLVILDGVGQPGPQRSPTLWIDPPQANSPVPIEAVAEKAAIRQWNAESPITVGLHARQDRISQTKLFRIRPGDIVLATAATSGGEERSGAVAMAVPGSATTAKFAVIGYDLLSPKMRFDVSTPLLFANLLDWMTPEAARSTESRLERVGAASVVLGPGEDTHGLSVTTDTGVALPFTLHRNSLQLFTNKPVVARVSTNSRTRVLALTLPDVAEVEWSGGSAPTGLPPLASFGASAVDLWQWLACAGALGLALEWILFGRQRSPKARPSRNTPAAQPNDRVSKEELVSQ